MQKITVCLSFIFLLFLVGCQTELSECEQCLECPKEKAMLDVVVAEWFINIDNENELFFDFWVYNYGSEEAKNVIVECAIYDETKLIKKVSEKIGNIASTSVTFKEIMTETLEVKLEEYLVVCYVIDCDNCDILYKRIPELKEQIERG